MDEDNICALVRKQENQYITGNTVISKHVTFSLKDNVDKIEAYLFSKHTSGETDNLGREKPFFNIVTAARNIWYRVTDIDRKDIRIKATKTEDMVPALLANIKLQEWMRREAFGQFLNDWGRALATYGSVVCKFVKKDGRLVPSLVPWNRLICDQVDFNNDVVIEKLYLTPAQLRKNKAYDQDFVEKLIETTGVRRTLDKQTKDIKDEFIEIYEVHGELALSMLTHDEKDEDTFVQQMHVVSFVESTDKKAYDDYTLYAGKEENPYLITHLIKEDGRVMGIGAVEHLFDAQWMVNHTAKLIKDQLDLASKLIFQTSDTNFVGRNVLTAIEQGDILIHASNEPITQVANNSHDITSLQAFGQQWNVLSQNITSTPDSLRGDTPPSGTAWHTVELVTQQSQSLFELMTENKGLHIEEIFRTFVIPFLKTQLDTSDEIATTLDSAQLSQIDSMYIPNKAIQNHNKAVFDTAMAGGIPSPYNQQESEQAVAKGLAKQGNSRFIKPTVLKDGQEVSVKWKEIFKDLEWEVEVEVTNEASDKKSTLDSLNSAFTAIIGMQGRPMTPEEKFVFNKLIETSGVASPIELGQLQQAPQPSQPSQSPQAPQPLQPSGGQVDSGQGLPVTQNQ